MPRVDGLQLLEDVQKRKLPVDVIITTGFATIDHAVQAMRLGAVDFLTKPINLEHLRLVVERAFRERALQDEVTALRQELEKQHRFHDILSKSPQMHDVFELISHVARTNSTVLIVGETGTGKELVARAVHDSSPRREAPFVAVNCAALPESLARERALRSRKRGLHERRRPAQGAVRARARRHHLPRRGRRDPAPHAGEAVAGVAGAPVRARRRARKPSRSTSAWSPRPIATS